MTQSDTHLHVDSISKDFGAVRALSDIELKVERGSFVCLLGPSGCGKTTLLRIIAGFETATNGNLMLDDVDITRLQPHKRGFGMVFQSLALFPHMSVAENIAYGLKLRGAGAKERKDRVEELLNVIELPAIADRQVSALSGGQRQRVAIARALAVQPKLFLLDEPLSALDAKLRDNMQVELRQLQRKFGVTTILVTHDQTEAMVLADRLVVMKDGVIRQEGSPTDVYRNPKDTFVADFLGSANLVKGTVSSGGKLRVLGKESVLKSKAGVGTLEDLAIRAEDIQLCAPDADQNTPVGKVDFVRDLGSDLEWIVAVEGEKLRIRTSAKQGEIAQLGQQIGLKIDPEKIVQF